MTTLTKLKIKMWLKKLEMKRNERKHLMSLVKVMEAVDGDKIGVILNGEVKVLA